MKSWLDQQVNSKNSLSACGKTTYGAWDSYRDYDEVVAFVKMKANQSGGFAKALDAGTTVARSKFMWHYLDDQGLPQSTEITIPAD